MGSGQRKMEGKMESHLHMSFFFCLYGDLSSGQAGARILKVMLQFQFWQKIIS
jgi:hypothetical protein